MSIISLVTGASSGLGECIAKNLCKKGHSVYVTARRTKKLKALKIMCSPFKGKIIPISGDLTKPNFRKRLIKTILKKSRKIDYLINNAGYGSAVEFEKQSLKDIENMFNLNIIAYEHLTQLVLPSMKKRKKGRIINISSVVTFTPLPYFATYNATKAAVMNFTKSLSFELIGTGVSISAVLPARMKTGFAHVAFKCGKLPKKHYNECIKKFNKIAGSPDKIAKFIVKNLDNKCLLLMPTLRAEFLLFLSYIPGLLYILTKLLITSKAKKDLKIK